MRKVPPEAQVIGENIRLIRKSANLSQQQLAHILGITFQQVQKYERGENRLPIEKLHFLKNYFGVPYHVFFIGLESGSARPKKWPKDLCADLKKVRSSFLQDKIGRVVAIMME